MHLVLATSLVPAGQPESGYEIANAAIADAFARAGVRVTHLGFKWPDKPLADPHNTHCLGSVQVRTADAGLGQKLIWQARSMAGNVPFVSAKLRVVPRRAVAEAIAAIGADAMVVNGTALAGAFEPALTSDRFIYIAHNVEHESAADAARHAQEPVERFMYRREARLLEGLEQRLVGGARHVLTLSEEDRAAFGLAGSPRAGVLPLVTPAADGASGPRVPAFDIGMIGSWTWAPNRIGLEWFLQHVMPHLPEQVTVAVAGALPAGFPQRDRRVRFLGRVLDAKQFLRQCRVVALAARAGTGVQLKTIEVFEMGLPAVATPSSLRGIAQRPDNLRVADAPQAFGQALARLVVDHRTGAAGDVDGAAFRSAQIAGMDAAIGRALEAISVNGR
ncbi:MULTISPECIES: glycosyltransferase family 4 protein [unclassified Roseitalea]|uniref:glycosyltransferase family 4 protein n=1 Tax=unclassified Roseitalea TaxID=2639107 RepID=UPI00273FD837|nr:MULTISPECIES: glycosyltransferase family 4 protein [unclassified Roseitalea]